MYLFSHRTVMGQQLPVKRIYMFKRAKRKTNSFTFGKTYKMTVGNYLGTEGIKTRRSVQDQIVGTKKESFHML